MIFGKKREKNAESVAVIGDAENSAVTEETLSPEAEEAIVPAEPEEPQDTKAIELENAEELAKEELRMQKYRAKLVVRRAKNQKKIAELNKAIYALNKEIEEITAEIEEIDGGAK